jgi:hypothetical protein
MWGIRHRSEQQQLGGPGRIGMVVCRLVDLAGWGSLAMPVAAITLRHLRSAPMSNKPARKLRL